MATPKTMAPKKSGAQASMNPWGWKPNGPDRNPFWKMSRPMPKAPATDRAVISTPMAAINGAPRAIRSRRNPSTPRMREDQRCVGRQGLLEVVVLGGGAADQRPGREHLAQVVDGRTGRGRRRPGGRDHLVEGPPGVGRPRDDTGHPGRVGEDGHGLGLFAFGHDHLQRSRRTGTEGDW